MLTRRYYVVTITPTVPTWELIPYTVRPYAKDRGDAIKQARKQFRESWQDWGHAPATYAARLDTNQSEEFNHDALPL